MSQTVFNHTVKGKNTLGGGHSWSEFHSWASATTGGELYIKLDRTSTYCDGDRGYVIWDTSSLPDNATISSSVLGLKTAQIANPFGGTAEFRVVTMASNTAVTNTDFNISNFGALAGSVALASVPSAGNTFNVIIDPTTISKDGYTKFGMIHSRDYANQDPGNSSGYMELRLNDSTNITLTIDWTTPPSCTTGLATDIQPISATLGGNVTDAGGGTVSSRGVCWSTTANPTTSSPKATAAGTTGAYTVSATGLLPGTLYHYRSFVITENSTQYGSDVTFRTPGGAIMFNLL